MPHCPTNKSIFPWTTFIFIRAKNIRALIQSIPNPVTVFVFIIATIAMLLFAAGTMNYFMVPSRLWESAALLLVAFTLFQPGYFLNKLQPEFATRSAGDIFTVAQASPDDASLRVRLAGENLNGDPIDARYLLPLGAMGAEGEARLTEGAGIEFREEEGKLFVDNLDFGGPAEQLGIDFDWEVVELDVEADRPPKELFYIPAFLLLGAIYLLQMRRKRKQPEGVPA